MHRAYSLLHVKAVDADRRVITGIATTPDPDRHGDILEPLGVRFVNPLPLLLYHDTERPVGVATFKTPTKDGIPFEATIADIEEPGTLRDRVQEAWQSLKAGILSGVSIGFRALESARLKSGGLHFLQTEVVELSLVTVPANAHATILSIKHFDQAATGRHLPGAAGVPVVRVSKDAPAMTMTEQIAQWSNVRVPKAARLAELMAKSADRGETLDEAEAQEFDTLEAEIKSLDSQVRRARSAEQLQIAGATPITTTKSIAEASTQRSGTSPVITVKANVAPGTAFVRYVCSVLHCRGNLYEASEYAAKRWNDSTPEVALHLKAAVAPGNATDATWAGPLVNQTIAADFLELLRPATILGKIPNLRRVPFNTKVPSQTAGGTYGWVGEAKPKPVTKLAFSAETLGINKAAGIIVLTEELVRLSNPSAEQLARNDMIAGIAQFLDQQFIDPAVAAVTGINPASITNGAPSAAATANPLADMMTLLNYFATNNVPIEGITFIMSQANALALSFQTNMDGSPLFPGVGISGGTYRGITIVTSQAASTNIIAVQPSMVLFADDGGVTVDASREASLQMDSAPASPPDATTVMVSLWQNNLVGLRAERFVSWKRVGTSVMYLTAAAYPAPTGAAGAPLTPAIKR